jgi:three-Cys-motif partner protein
MVQSDRHFHDFAPHTLLKHATYKAYVQRWARILLARPGRSLLRIVDACAGMGGDDAGNPGSPVIAAVEADRAGEQMSQLRGEPVRIEVVAIEKDRKRFEVLAARMAGHGGRHRALQGTLGDYIVELERDFARVPMLFFIDPFGLEPLKAEVVRRCLAGGKNEIFLLFADQAALRHHGVLLARDDEEQAPAQGSLFGDDTPQQTAQPDPARVHTALTAAAVERIMDSVYGEIDWRSGIANVPASRRRQAFVEMYVQLLTGYGAQRVLPLPIIGRQHKYHLIYATHSPYGYRVMKEEVGRSWNAGLVTERAKEMMKLGTSLGRQTLLRDVLTHFGGFEAPWWVDDRNAVSVRRFALEDTAAMPHQMEDLKEDLHRYRMPGRALRYRFPTLG